MINFAPAYLDVLLLSAGGDRPLVPLETLDVAPTATTSRAIDRSRPVLAFRGTNCRRSFTGFNKTVLQGTKRRPIEQVLILRAIAQGELHRPAYSRLDERQLRVLDC